MLTEELEVRRMVLRHAIRIHASLLSQRTQDVGIFRGCGLTGDRHYLSCGNVKRLVCHPKPKTSPNPNDAVGAALRTVDRLFRGGRSGGSVVLWNSQRRPHDRVTSSCLGDIRPFDTSDSTHHAAVVSARSNQSSFSNAGLITDSAVERRDSSSRSLVTQQICVKPECVSISSNGRRSIGDIQTMYAGR